MGGDCSFVAKFARNRQVEAVPGSLRAFGARLLTSETMRTGCKWRPNSEHAQSTRSDQVTGSSSSCQEDRMSRTKEITRWEKFQWLAPVQRIRLLYK